MYIWEFMKHIMKFFLVQGQVCKIQKFQKVSKPFNALMYDRLFFCLKLKHIEVINTEFLELGTHQKVVEGHSGHLHMPYISSDLF